MFFIVISAVPPVLFQGVIYARSLEGVFQRVVHQVLDHAVEPLSVAYDLHRRLADVGFDHQTCRADFVLHLGEGLVGEAGQVKALMLYRYFAAGGLGKLEYVRHDVLQPLRLLLQYPDVLPCLRFEIFP